MKPALHRQEVAALNTAKRVLESRAVGGKAARQEGNQVQIAIWVDGRLTAKCACNRPA